MDGVSATESVRAAVPRSAVVVLSIRDDAGIRQRAADAGASAFVAKHDSAGQLLPAIR